MFYNDSKAAGFTLSFPPLSPGHMGEGTRMAHVTPPVAIVTPSYNTGPHVRAAVESVLSQDYPHLDYLVMDGGSTDDTVTVLESFGPRLRWGSERDRGQSDAINRGFALTRGDGLGWLNSDATSVPRAVPAAAAFLAR